MRKAAIAVVLGLLSVPAAGQQMWFEVGIDCGHWVSARNTGSPVYETYLIGLLDGWVVTLQIDFWRTPSPASREAIFLWMDNWCRANPAQHSA